MNIVSISANESRFAVCSSQQILTPNVTILLNEGSTMSCATYSRLFLELCTYLVELGDR